MTEELVVATPTHGRVLVARASARSRGAIVGFHGYAQHADDMLAELQVLAPAEAWTRVSVQALHRFYRGRSDVTVASWMTRQDRETLIADNIAYVDQALAAALDGQPPGRLVCCGFSQGVAMAFRAAVRGRCRADAVVAVCGDVPPELLADEAVRWPRVLLTAGTSDKWYPPARLSADAAALRARGADVDEVVFPGGHEWHDDVRRRVAALLQEL